MCIKGGKSKEEDNIRSLAMLLAQRHGEQFKDERYIFCLWLIISCINSHRQLVHSYTVVRHYLITN